MNQRTEGTIELDGLIEVRLPMDDALRRTLDQWLSFTRQAGLKFNIETGGASVSIMPDTDPQPVAPIGEAPQRVIAQLVEQLAGALPEAMRGRIFSTLRSAEYRPGEAVQAVYAIRSDGKVDLQQRSVQVKTVAPPQPLSTRDKVKMAAIGLVVAMAALGVGSLFVDWRGTFMQFVNTMRPYDAQKITVDAGAFDGLLSVSGQRIESGKLIVVVMRTEHFPRNAAEAQAALAAEPAGLRRLALESIVKGYITVEFYDPDDKFIASASLRVRDLRTHAQAELAMGLPAGRRLGRVLLSY